MLRKAYFGIATVGLIATWIQNIRYFTSDGNDGMLGFIQDAWANPAAASITSDAMVVALAAMVFMFVEGRRLRVPNLWLYFALAPAVAIAFAFPLFLAAREKELAANP